MELFGGRSPVGRNGESGKDRAMSLEDEKRAAAAAAIADVREGMRLGLGSGSTARYFVDLLGERVAQGFDCLCVPTSEATGAQARQLGIALTDLDTIDRLDLTIDGADELDADLNLIKGGGGALLREKIVAAASDRMIVIAEQFEGRRGHSGPVSAAHRGQPLPGSARRSGMLAGILEAFEAKGGMKLRLDAAGAPFVTDGGHLILDAFFGRISAPKALSDALLGVPGVVQHGLFLGICTAAYVAGPAGVKRLGQG